MELSLAWLAFALHFALAAMSTAHALLYKRDSRAALGWIAVSFAYPFVGPVLYFLFGINRLRTRARQLKGKPSRRLEIGYEGPEFPERVEQYHLLPELAEQPELAALARSSNAVTHRALVGGNRVVPLFSGEDAYAEMLRAIGEARRSVAMATYIFETNRSGREFVAALAAARRRGVEVRVLLDGFGEWYSLPRAGSLLKREDVDVARFIPPRILPPALHVNLRNHRKLLVVDCAIGFTGGMNIGDRHLRHNPARRNETADIHFRIEGPVVAQLQDVFDEDWSFAAGEPGRPPCAIPASVDRAICRVVTDGPNEDLGKLAMTIVSAVALARERVSIMTPYFLPPVELVVSLQAAALRGVDVSVILPQKTNQPLVHWATRKMLRELLLYGVRVYYQPPPFAHSKLLLIDDEYAQIGSANLDPRSLRLNFEIVVEVFDREFVGKLLAHFDRTRSASREESLAGVDGRRWPAKLRDAAAWLFSPYL